MQVKMLKRQWKLRFTFVVLQYYHGCSVWQSLPGFNMNASTDQHITLGVHASCETRVGFCNQEQCLCSETSGLRVKK